MARDDARPEFEGRTHTLTRLFLVRHGQTTSNEIHALDTALPGAHLTDLGKQQALSAGQRLAERTGRLHVLSSMANRAQQTAANVANSFGVDGRDIAVSSPESEFAKNFSRGRGQGLSSFPDATALQLAGAHADRLAMVQGVSEIPAGEMEMKNDEDSHERYHQLLGDWLHGDIGKIVPGGFSGIRVLDDYLPQALAAGSAGVLGETDVALVSHGAVIRFVATWLGGVDPEFAYRAYLPNSHIVTLELPDDLPDVLEEVSGGTVDDFRDALRGRFDVPEWGEFGRPQLRS